MAATWRDRGTRLRLPTCHALRTSRCLLCEGRGSLNCSGATETTEPVGVGEQPDLLGPSGHGAWLLVQQQLLPEHWQGQAVALAGVWLTPAHLSDLLGRRSG